MKRPSPTIVALLITSVFGAAVAYLALHHELWRDEVRALNISTGARSIGDLFALLRNEGHPPLWYLLLYFANHLTHSMLVLKPIAAGCAIGAAYVFLRHAPLPLWLKILFLAGAIPLYEYSVLCRGHGLGMLLLFAVAATYGDRFTRPAPLLATLVLLANVNAYTLMLAVAIVLSIGIEAAIVRPPLSRRAIVHGSIGLVILAAAIAGAIAVMLPDSTSTVTSLRSLNAAAVARSVASALVHPGSPYAFMSAGQAWLANLVFWLAAAVFVFRPWLLLAWVMAGVAFEAFSMLVYPSDFMQRGLLIVFFVCLTWMAQSSSPPAFIPERWRSWEPRWNRIRLALLAVVLLTQIPPGLAMASRDLQASLSSSESLGRYLSSSAQLRDAIVIAEPAVMVEALPYYARNRIYLPRENKDMVKVGFTTSGKQSLSLDDLADVAERLRRETGRPVALVMGHQLSDRGPFSIRYPYGLEFHYSIDELKRFASRATFVTVFDRAVSDENYALFLFPRR